jgi:triphosphoribosyl-dephospho-CoA synthase
MIRQRDFVDMRDRRQRAIDRLVRQAAATGSESVLVIGVNVPGPSKYRPGLSNLLRGTLDSLCSTAGLKLLFSQRDLLGPFHIGYCKMPPLDAKRAALAVEAAGPAARLLDIDVYRADGSQVNRTELCLLPRPCLLCAEPARECILLRRHSNAQLLEQVDLLLRPFVPFPRYVLPERLMNNLRMGALRELELTPKPGLVDRHDSGSHTDLSYHEMRASADLLPLYFDDILGCHQERRPLRDFVQAGINAENRMIRKIRSNAHRGYIFLSGLVLMAAFACEGRVDLLRKEISKIAGGFFTQFKSADSQGASMRNRHGLGGIRMEAEKGLPAVFEYGWPMYREALDAGWSPEHAGFYLMAVLMQRLEDSTAVHRCGLEGLSRLREDGSRLQIALEQQQPPEPMLAALNHEYCKTGLTMGGVADCMALTFALQDTAD